MHTVTLIASLIQMILIDITAAYAQGAVH